MCEKEVSDVNSPTLNPLLFTHVARVTVLFNEKNNMLNEITKIWAGFLHRYYISHPLAVLFNMSICIGHFPKVWKESDVMLS